MEQGRGGEGEGTYTYTAPPHCPRLCAPELFFSPSFSLTPLSRLPPPPPHLSPVFSLLPPTPRPAAPSGNEMLFSENGAGMRTGLPGSGVRAPSYHLIWYRILTSALRLKPPAFKPFLLLLLHTHDPSRGSIRSCPRGTGSSTLFAAPTTESKLHFYSANRGSVGEHLSLLFDFRFFNEEEER